MSSAISLQNIQRYPVDEAGLRQAAATVLKLQRADAQAQLTIVITDNATLRRLNLTYRQERGETDILSFPAGPSPVAGGDGRYLGDILIAYPYAKRVAKSSNLNLESALRMLVAHGVLHLLGYDHDSEAAKEAMWRAQAAALDSIGIDASIVDSYGGA